MKHVSPRLATIILCAGLFGLVLFAFAGAIDCGYVFDDGVYVIDNVRLHSGLTWDLAAWAFRTFYSGNWHPLTWISLAADMSIYRGNPAGLHLTSILLHALNSVLLMLVLRAITGSAWRSALAAALFAVHPLRVESVVWITERKDVLSLLFGLLALWAYIGYSRAPSVGRYLTAALCLALGLMAKPMLVTMPVVFVLLDWWRRVQTGRGSPEPFIRLLPLFLISAASAIATFIAQLEWGNLVPQEHLPFGIRAANALVSYVAYVRKMVWPCDLAVYYPHPETGIPAWKTAASSAVVLLSAFGTWRYRKSTPHVFVGLLWYAVTLLPVIGVVQAGNQAMADRYTYLPMIGLLIALAWSLPEPVTFTRKAAVGTAAVLAIGLLTAQTRAETLHWRSDITLFGRALQVTSGNWMAHYSLGRAFAAKGDYPRARYHFEKALDIYPEYEDARLALGVVLRKLGRPEQAVGLLRQVVERNPHNTLARVNLAAALLQAGYKSKAADVLRQSRSLDPKGTADIIRRYGLESALPRSR